jgi:hypothetical protein
VRRAIGDEHHHVGTGDHAATPGVELALTRNTDDLTADLATFEASADVLHPVEPQGTTGGVFGRRVGRPGQAAGQRAQAGSLARFGRAVVDQANHDLACIAVDHGHLGLPHRDLAAPGCDGFR